MAGIAAAIIGAGVIGAGASIYASTKQTAAANNAIAAQQGMFNTAQQEQQPFIQAGQSAIPQLQALLGLGPQGAAGSTAALQNIPGFQFISDLAQKGVANQGTTTGLGGNTLLAGANAGTNVALASAWQPLVNSLQGLVQTGAGTAGNVGQQAVQTGANVGQNLVGIGNAQGGAATSAASSIGNSLTTAALFSKLFGGNNSMYGVGNSAPGAIGSSGYGIPPNEVAQFPSTWGTGGVG